MAHSKLRSAWAHDVVCMGGNLASPPLATNICPVTRHQMITRAAAPEIAAFQPEELQYTAVTQSTRGRAGQRRPHISHQPEQVLDMDYMQKVYKATRLPQHTGEESPLQARINYGIMKRIMSCQTLSQLKVVINQELEAMSARSLASAMAAVAFELHSKQNESEDSRSSNAVQEGSSQLNSQLHEQSMTDIQQPSNDIQSIQQQQNEGHEGPTNVSHNPANISPTEEPYDLQLAQQLVHVLCIRMATGLLKGQLSVATDQVVTAVLCAGRVWGSRTAPSDLKEAITALLNHIQRHLFMCSCKDLGRIAQGLGYLRLRMDNAWMASFQKVCVSKMPQMDGLQLSLVAWACAKLGIAPDRYFLVSMTTYTSPHLSSMSQASLSNLLWAYSEWREDPGQAWRDAAWSALQAALPTMDANCFSASFLAMCRLQHNPSTPLLNACTSRMLQLSSSMNPQHHCQVLTALSRLVSYLPDEEVILLYVQAMQPHLPQATPAQLTSIAWSLGRIGFLPPQLWVRDWISCACQNVRGMTPRDAVLGLSAFAGWRVVPPRHFLQDIFELTLAQCRAGVMPATSAAKQLQALASLRMVPPRQLLKELLIVLGSEAKLQEAETVQKQVHPSDAGTARNRSAQQAMAEDLGRTIICLPKLLGLYTREQLQQTQPIAVVIAGNEVLQTTLANSSSSFETKVEEDQGTSPTLNGNLKRPHRPSEGLLPTDPVVIIPRHPSADVADLLLPPSLAVPLFAAARQRLKLMTARQLCGMVCALASMRFNPGREFLQEHVSTIAPFIGELADEAKLRIDAAYQILSNDSSCIKLDRKQRMQ